MLSANASPNFVKRVFLVTNDMDGTSSNSKQQAFIQIIGSDWTSNPYSGQICKNELELGLSAKKQLTWAEIKHIYSSNKNCLSFIHDIFLLQAQSFDRLKSWERISGLAMRTHRVVPLLIFQKNGPSYGFFGRSWGSPKNGVRKLDLRTRYLHALKRISKDPALFGCVSWHAAWHSLAWPYQPRESR